MYGITNINKKYITPMKPCHPISSSRSRFTKRLRKWSDPRQAQKMAVKYLGNKARIFPSGNREKKYRICDVNTGNYVRFGQMGYEDYTKHRNKTRRHNYLTRTAGIRGDWKRNPYSANNLSRNILW
jgi:hypothetical protein